MARGIVKACQLCVTFLRDEGGDIREISILFVLIIRMLPPRWWGHEEYLKGGVTGTMREVGSGDVLEMALLGLPEL
jgi:hypothetical protein